MDESEYQKKVRKAVAENDEEALKNVLYTLNGIHAARYVLECMPQDEHVVKMLELLKFN